MRFAKFVDRPLGIGEIPSAPGGSAMIDAAAAYAMEVGIVQHFDLERLPATASLVVELRDSNNPELVVAGPVDLAEIARGTDDGIAQARLEVNPCYPTNVIIAWTLDDHIDPDGQSALGSGEYVANVLFHHAD